METLDHRKIAFRILDQAKEFLAKEDAIQASEKLYKAAEETVKALAAEYAGDMVEEADKEGRWKVGLLEKAARKISRRLNPEVRHWWDTAYYLHVEGFHEARLDMEGVKERIQEIENLVELCK